MEVNIKKEDKKKRALFLVIGSFLVLIGSVFAQGILSYLVRIGIFEAGSTAHVILVNVIVVVLIISLVVMPVGALMLALAWRQKYLDKIREAGKKPVEKDQSTESPKEKADSDM